jgi:phosphoesterase RecJ-like protein
MSGRKVGIPELVAEIAAFSSANGATVTVASHYSPDPDAYGSSCGLALALIAGGRHTVKIVNEDGPSKRLGWIPGVERVEPGFDAGIARDKHLLIACDCGDQGRLGDRLAPIVRATFGRVISIDHHATNDFFGDLNYVVPTASSTSEMILALLEAMGSVPITKDVAKCLYAGIAADTGSFKYSSTSDATFDAARRLVRYGAVPAEIARELFQRTSVGAMKLHSLAMSKVELFSDGGIAEVVVTKEMVTEAGASPEDGDDLKSVAQSIDGVMVSAVIREYDDLWRVSLRAKTPDYDVAKVAESFGGGGHKAAAAFRWRKSLVELKPLLRKRLEAALMAGNNGGATPNGNG